MPQGLHEWVPDKDAWATYLNQTVKALNDGFVLDQSGEDTTGVLTTRATFASTTTFTVAGDGTAFYVAGRRLRIVHAGGTTYCSVTSSAFAAGVTTVTIGTITQGPATMTTPITSMAVSPVFTGNAGNTSSPTHASLTGVTSDQHHAQVHGSTDHNSTVPSEDDVKKWALLG